MNTKTLATLLIFLSVPAIGQVSLRPLPGGINGVVRLSDGSPLEGAVVTAQTDCREWGPGFVREVTTSADGSFYVPPFATGGCNRIRLLARKTEDFWLETGRHVFYAGDNGTTPVVVIPSSTRTEIKMGSRGGLVSFRVRDASTDSFIWAAINLKRIPVQDAKFPSMEIATGNDGSPDTLLLPAGDYKIAVVQYSCKGSYYFAANPASETMTVEAGQRIEKIVSIDIRLIKARKSYNNPSGKSCIP